MSSQLQTPHWPLVPDPAPAQLPTPDPWPLIPTPGPLIKDLELRMKATTWACQVNQNNPTQQTQPTQTKPHQTRPDEIELIKLVKLIKLNGCRAN